MFGHIVRYGEQTDSLAKLPCPHSVYVGLGLTAQMRVSRNISFCGNYSDI